MFALNLMKKKILNSICQRQMQLNPPKWRNKSATQMKSELCSDEVAAAMADLIQPKTQFSTSSAQADFITLVTSSQSLFWDFVQRSLL